MAQVNSEIISSEGVNADHLIPTDLATAVSTSNSRRQTSNYRQNNYQNYPRQNYNNNYNNYNNNYLNNNNDLRYYSNDNNYYEDSQYNNSNNSSNYRQNKRGPPRSFNQQNNNNYNNNVSNYNSSESFRTDNFTPVNQINTENINSNPSNSQNYRNNNSRNNKRNKMNKPKTTDPKRSESINESRENVNQPNRSQFKQKSEQNPTSKSNSASHIKKSQPKPAIQFETRSEILIDQLMKFNLECMVCCHKIKDDKSIWSCNVCYHIFHLYCIKKWANSPAAKVDEENPNKWRCPGCQTIHQQIPNRYTCFCSKKINPELNRQDENKPYHLRQLPHSCGQICGKPLGKQDENVNQNLICKHKCVLLCHPGPCQQCDALVTRTCNCGKAKFQVKCSSLKLPACETKCDKLLNCSKHICDEICHSGNCKPCKVEIEQECYSHETKRLVKCESLNVNSKYACDEKCGKLLTCGKHYCDSQCHDGECPTCPLMPSKLNYCPCGKTPMRELLIKNKIIRTSCMDPIPTCEKTCNKLLHTIETGQTDSELHFCQSKCHTNECPPCLKLIDIKCRCGKESETIECSKKSDKLCNRRCHKKKLCGRHQCNEICCNDKDHFCTIVCNRQLDCGRHKCELLCHKGPCQRCLVASFEERICECGKTVQYPPIRCGTKPLECPHLCTREHDCMHAINHNCHWEPKCPPCSYLTSKMCMGNHELRHNIPCFMKDVSCGRACDKQLPNCSHKCIKVCHKDDNCLDENEQCMQPCNKKRPHCEHICGEPCHANQPCPDTVCQALIQAKCKCGLKTKQIKCQQRMYEPASQIVFENLASELKEMLSCRSIDITTFKNTEALKKKHELPCDEECFIAERSRNLAQALQIESTLKPKVIYSDFLKNFAREEPAFVSDVEKKLEASVKETKLSMKTNKKYFNFPAMKPYERRLIHELAPYYGFETMSEDPEPFRNVCLIATKDKCSLPSSTLMQSIETKTKQSAMPRLTGLKQLNQVVSSPVQSNLTVLQYSEPDYLPVSSAFSVLNDAIELSDEETKEAASKNEKKIDYFDITD